VSAWVHAPDGTTAIGESGRSTEALSHLDELLRKHGIEYWLFGGWAVDFHVGKVTRSHDDLDLAIWSHDGERVRVLLTALAGATHRKRTTACMELDNVRVEVAFLDHGEWPPNSFEHDVGKVAWVRARVVSLSSLKADKSMLRDDESVAAKDRADSVTLGQLPV
jgi:Aminoglycoside-2''-adenylyltransferase